MLNNFTGHPHPVENYLIAHVQVEQKLGHQFCQMIFEDHQNLLMTKGELDA